MALMKRPWWIAAPLAWVAVVTIVALAAWWVIDDAGHGILAESAHVPATSGPSGHSAGTSGAKHHRHTRPTTAPSTTSAGPSTAPATPVTQPTTGTTSEPGSEPPASATTRTWQGDAGILRVSCTGTALRLDGASPHDGYVVDQAEHEGGRELEVKFRSTDGDREVQIHVVCSSGIPDFTVEQSGGEDDD